MGRSVKSVRMDSAVGRLILSISQEILASPYGGSRFETGIFRIKDHRADSC